MKNQIIVFRAYWACGLVLLLTTGYNRAQDFTTTTNSNNNKRYVTTYLDSSSDIPGFDNAEDFFRNFAETLTDFYEMISSLPLPGLNASVSIMSENLAKAIAELPFVVAVEEDHRYQLDNPLNRVAYTPTAGSEVTPYGITMVGALKVDDSNVSNRKVCIIDTGYAAHPDLPPLSDVTGDVADPAIGTWSEDGVGHGTHVAGTIAAIGGNNIGVVGVIRNGAVQLHIYRVFDSDGYLYASTLINAIQSCADAGANVVSMSLGGEYGSVFERNAFKKFYEEGILFVAAAGNSGGPEYSYPASYESVISVAAVDENKDVAYFSQFNDQIDLAAPGVHILSTVPGDGYEYLDGTSMACPAVAGVAALVWSLFPDKTNKEIRAALEASAEDLGPPGVDVDYGFGLVRADLAVAYLQGNLTTPIQDPVADPVQDPVTADPTEDATFVDTIDDTIVADPYDDDIYGDDGTIGIGPINDDIYGDDDGAEGCVNYPSDWVDSDGDGCDDFYNELWKCIQFGSLFADPVYGLTAIDVCCTCRGGQSQSSTGQGSCVDDKNWVDSDGDGCDWYASDVLNCALYGEYYENNGKTASVACCACQDVTVTTVYSENKSLPRVPGNTTSSESNLTQPADSTTTTTVPAPDPPLQVPAPAPTPTIEGCHDNSTTSITRSASSSSGCHTGEGNVTEPILESGSSNNNDSENDIIEETTDTKTTTTTTTTTTTSGINRHHHPFVTPVFSIFGIIFVLT